MIKCICKKCGKIFFTHNCWIKRGGGKYCSRNCKDIAQKEFFKYKKNHPFYGKSHSAKAKEKMKNSKMGSKNPRWIKGKKKTIKGYIKIYQPNHPYQYQNYVLEHRFIMEQYLGRYLTKEEFVHHKNGIPDDNRLENLHLFVQGKNWHPKICPKCGFEFLIR